MKEDDRTYYPTRLDAMANRQKGQRVYHKPGKGFYLSTPKRKTFWEDFLGR